jgi:hypothetical protein
MRRPYGRAGGACGDLITRAGNRPGGAQTARYPIPLSQFEHAGSEGLRWCGQRQLVVGGQVMGIKTDQALAPLCDLDRRQLAALSATIVGIALASLILFG